MTSPPCAKRSSGPFAPKGHDVALAGDGRQALGALNAWPPDAVVLDVLMPRVDGFEACPPHAQQRRPHTGP